MAHRARHVFVDLLVFRDVFGGKALNAESGVGAAIHKERHMQALPLRVTEWIDLDQVPTTGRSSGRRNAAGAIRMPGQGGAIAGPCHKKRGPPSAAARVSARD
jgi:hypothetical protein